MDFSLIYCTYICQSYFYYIIGFLDRIAGYDCACEPGWGGKNCSVELIGCHEVVCLNGGSCSPWLVGENDHKANCTCLSGFEGLRCQSRTTFSFNGKSYIKVPSNRQVDIACILSWHLHTYSSKLLFRLEGYELQLKFRTTLGNGLVAIGQGNTHFSLQLRNGRLNLHSNLISKFEGILIGERLNNTEWQKVHVAVNSSHLTLGVNDLLQATQPINPSGDNDTIFFNTFLGGIVRDQQILANNVPSFTGCIQDIIVNDVKITEEAFKDTSGSGVEQKNTRPGCPREEQCAPNPCQNEGICTDLWSEYRCSCPRPSLGSSCQYSKRSDFILRPHEEFTLTLKRLLQITPEEHSASRTRRGVLPSWTLRTPLRTARE
jgi:protein crumbs